MQGLPGAPQRKSPIPYPGWDSFVLSAPLTGRTGTGPWAAGEAHPLPPPARQDELALERPKNSISAMDTCLLPETEYEDSIVKRTFVTSPTRKARR